MSITCCEADSRQVLANQAFHPRGPDLWVACGDRVDLTPGRPFRRCFQHRPAEAARGVGRDESPLHRVAEDAHWRALRKSLRDTDASLESRVGRTCIADVFAVNDGVSVAIEECPLGVAMDARVVPSRRTRGLTQVQLKVGVGVAHQTLHADGARACRIPVSTPPALARTLGVSLESLFSQDPKASRGKRGPAPQWQDHRERIGALPRAEQKFVLQVLESVLAQAGAR